MKKNYIFLFLFAFQGFSQTLETYIKVALEKNPLVKTAFFSFKTQETSIDVVGNLPETQINIAPFLMPVQTRVGNQIFKMGIKQTLPWRGILKNEKKAQQLKTAAQENFYDLTKAKIALNVKQKYHLLCYLKSQKYLLEKNKNLLKSIQKITLQNLSTHQKSMSAVLKIKIKQNDIENQIKMLQNTLESEKKSFRLLLGVDENYFVKIEKEYLKIVAKIPTELLDLKNHFEIQMLENQSEYLDFLQKIERKKRLPEFTFGMDYIFVNPLNKENIFENGRDILMATIGIKMPVFSKKFSSKEKALKWQQKSLKQKTKHLENTLKDAYQKTKKNLKNLKNTLAVLKKNIKEIQKIYQVLLSEYIKENSYFQEILDTWQWQLDIELQKNNAQRKYADHMAIIDYLKAN